jgi:hypothetical protein
VGKHLNFYVKQSDLTHAIMYKSKHSWWMDNNHTKKLVIERLTQTTYDFPNNWGTMIGC